MKLSSYLRNLGFLLLATLILSSCTYIKTRFTKDEDSVARVNNTYLDRANLAGIVPPGTSARDSLVMVKNYINNWIRNQLILEHAEGNLTEEQQDFTSQLEEYRKSLVIYTFEQKLINQNLDTTIREEEVETYYEQNKANFELRDNIVKVIMFKISSDSAKALKAARELLRPDSIVDFDAVERFSLNRTQQNIISYDSWYLFNDLLQLVPITTYNESAYLENHKFVELPVGNSIYLVRFYDFKIKNGLSPLSFERNNIRNIILNRRKIELINKMRDDLYDKASKKNEFEIY
ncbi:MAG: peptidylprolyl isomerase [Bacteroidales bacterium]|nr:peptidylprolyl isomerase [Bacteroidales bacterium]MDD3664079.1 peptidylprolyl isomerase [Bacteroidales bacterium]